MKKRKINQLLSRYIFIFIVSIGTIMGLAFGVLLRDKHIAKQKMLISNDVSYTQNVIYSKIYNINENAHFMSEIISSQLNNPRSYFKFDLIFRKILSGDPSIVRSFIVLSEKYTINDDRLYSLRDSVGRINVSWEKSPTGIIVMDTLKSMNNNMYYETVKNSGKATIFSAKTQTIKSKKVVLKTLVYPIYDGDNFVGVIGMTIRMDFVKDLLLASSYKNYIFMADEDGVVFYDGVTKHNIGKYFDKITNKKFNKYQADIIHNRQVYAISGDKVLYFSSIPLSFFSVKWKIGIILPKSKIYFKANLYILYSLIVFLFFSLLIVYIFNFYINKSVYSIDEIIDDFEQLTKGNLKIELSKNNKFEEIDKLSSNIERMRDRLKQLSKIHNQIKNQESVDELEELSEKDEIAQSINQAIKAIKERRISRMKVEENKRRDEWVNNGLNKLHEASKIEENSITKLADKINDTISVYSDAFLSTIFLAKKDEKTGEQYLEAISTFGFNEKRAFKKIIKYGEGIVGTVALEKKKQYIDKIPDDYHIIISGLSEMKPKSILVVPLIFEDEFLGILEVSFLKILEEYELKFFELASSEIALSLKNILSNILRNKLVENLQQQTVEVEKTQKLLQDKIDELKKKEMQMLKSQADLQAMVNAVDNTLMTIEYTTSGILITANDKYLKTMHYTLEELKGVNVLDLVKTERQELQEVINKVSQGQSYEKIMKRFTKYGEVKWLHSTYTPYYDTKGEVTKVLYFAFDVTETKKYTEKLEKEISILRKQIKILREKL
jgi:PAS domain S-box-containing protein